MGIGEWCRVPMSPCPRVPLSPISLAGLQDQTAVQPTFHDIRTSLLGVFLNESVSGDHLSRHIPIIPIIVGFTSTILVDGNYNFIPHVDLMIFAQAANTESCHLGRCWSLRVWAVRGSGQLEKGFVKENLQLKWLRNLDHLGQVLWTLTSI